MSWIVGSAPKKAASGLLYLNSGGPAVESAQIITPDAPTIYPDSSIAESGDASTTPDTAFSRWFNLLTGDATAPSDDIEVPSRDQDHASSAEQHNGILSTYQLGAGSANEREVTSIYRAPDSAELDQNVSQRQPWHGSEPSKLNSEEQRLFENYVKYGSTWVRRIWNE
jgi:hypothetical protein